MHGLLTATAITVLALLASMPNAAACTPVSPGSSVMDCRTDAQIEAEQDRRAQAKKVAEQELARIAAAEQERQARARQPKPVVERKPVKPEDAIASAQKFCMLIDVSRMASRKCYYSDSLQIVDIWINTTPDETASMCYSAINIMSRDGSYSFTEGWKLRVFTLSGKSESCDLAVLR